MVQPIAIETQTDETYPLKMTLRPRRSADPRVAYVLCAGLALVWLAAGVLFSLMGGWPIFGFFGAEFIFIFWAVRFFLKKTEVVETIDITQTELRISQRSPSINAGQAKHWTFPSYWAQVVFSGSPTSQGTLEVRSHGQAVEIGAFLAACEKRRVADALTATLRELKNHPNFK